MRVKTFSKAVVVAAAVAWMSGCSSTATTSDSSEAADQAGQQQDQAASTGTGSDGSMQQGQMDHAGMAQGQAAIADLQTIYYFDFDKAVIKSSAFEDLSAHAKYLSANPAVRLVLEGHADERGTREYNMALGERRAKAVNRFLTVQGAAANQIEVVSYGEERPAMMGRDDASQSKNRRVELKYSR